MDEDIIEATSDPQKEILYNKLLPYYDKLEEESQLYLKEIKTNLVKAVLCHEIIPGVKYWTHHLAKYIKLYGRKFSKEDHLNFIHLLYEVLIIPDLELTIVVSVACVLSTLLKKFELLSRDDLELQWRPLYELCERTVCSSYEHPGMQAVLSNLESILKTLIRYCRLYFPVESTQEMLDEWRPLLCPFDVTTAKAMTYFELFLCTSLPPNQHDKGFRLWFSEFMKIWEHCHNSPSWENALVMLFSRLACDSIGYINWEPYIPMIFTRFLRSLNLPGTLTKVQVYRCSSSFDIQHSVTWISSMLGGGSSCQLHINRLFKALESYYHPSNSGRWILKLQRLLSKLPEALIKRLHRERHRKETWETPIPPDYRLKDIEITEFVNSLKSATLLSMFCKIGTADCSLAMRNLAILRPEIVVPPVIERVYSSLETLTEPHRLTAAMHCIALVARSLVQKNKFFPEGPTHVVPLLMQALPGIDPNDVRKCMVTFQFMSTFTILILLVDSSKAVNENTNLSEIEQQVCLATVNFEDFVLQFMDKCFALIENSSMDNTNHLDRNTERLNVEENVLEVGLASSFSSILTQCSPEIYKAALRKLHTFVSNRILEVKVSGKYAANMCQSASRVNPELALQAFVPHFTKIVLALTENADVLEEEKLDDELLFGLLVLSEVVRCNGIYVLKYHNDIRRVLQRTLHLKCREGYLLACTLLRHTLKSYTMLYPTDFCSINNFWEKCNAVEPYLFIHEWGKPGDVHNLNMKCHIASDEEIEAAKKLLVEFLLPELDQLSSWAKGEKPLSREDIHLSLNIVLDCLCGASNALPMWSGEHVIASESVVPLFSTVIQECGSRDIIFDDKRNMRLYITEVMHQVFDQLQKSCEDDTKSLFLIIRIYRGILFHWGIGKKEFDTRWKGFHVVKRALENKLRGRKQHIRALLVDRISLQNEMRMLEKNKSLFTETHELLMKDLLQLSISHYSEVRSRAQSVLQACFTTFHSCSKILIPDLLELLQKDPIACHEEFKGVLHIILGQQSSSLLTVQNWKLIQNLWPAIVSAKHSEKPSIIKLFDQICVSVQKYFDMIQIELKIHENCLTVAKKIFPLPALSLTEDDIQRASQLLKERGISNEEKYISLVEDLVNLLENGSLHWRHYHLASTMLLILIRYDVPFPENAVRLFVNHLIHDTLLIRKMAITGMSCILRQQKRVHPLKVVDPSSIDVQAIPVHPILEQFGQEKPANFWLQYNSLRKPDSQQTWDEYCFVHKTHVGFYAWSKPFKVYANDADQPKLNRSRDELSKEEVPIYDAFMQQQFIDKLITFLSLEERKGQDKFDCKKFDLFKSLFRNFGNTFLPLFLDHLKKLVLDTQESAQRCAAEIIAGLLRGSKHWNFQMMESLKEVIIPILRSAFNHINPETLNDWGNCILTASESRDPNKYYWLFELLMEEPIKEESGSFLESSWLYLLLGAIAQQEWRVFELLHRILKHIEPRLNHSYQNVREKIGSLLGNIFMYDIPYDGDVLNFAPRRSMFLQSVIPKLKILESADASVVNGTVVDHSATKEVTGSQQICVWQSDEWKSAVNLLKTMCRWLTISLTRTIYSTPPEVLQLLPIICLMRSDTSDDGIQKDCTLALEVLGQALFPPESMDIAINTIHTIASSDFWRSRSVTLSFLQMVISSNLFTVMHNESWIENITKLVLQCLHDLRVEVREAAGETLCGLFHCEVIKINEGLLGTFKKKCERKLKYTQHVDGVTSNCSVEPAPLRERHAGILGLCACVNAFPYDVPEFLPDILVLLGDHLHDPQPIQTTIKKTLSNFRRTHHDNWRDHKLKFTDDQLAVITDLLVSPSYYA